MKAICFVLALVAGTLAEAKEYTYTGTWKTTNRKLDGTMTCTVKETAKDQWEGTFAGNWHGSDWSYRVTFSGPPHELRGKATIDGARYDWAGSIDTESFQGSFTGTRYNGAFELSRRAR